MSKPTVPPSVAQYAVAELAALKQPIAGVDERAAFERIIVDRYGYSKATISALWNGQGYDESSLCMAWVVFQQARAQLAAPAGVPDGWVVTEVRRPIEWEDADGTVEVQVSDGSKTSTAIFYKKSGAMGWKRLGMNNVVYWKPLAAAPASCQSCEPDGVYSTDGAGPFDCPDCGKKAAAPASDVVPVPRAVAEAIANGFVQEQGHAINELRALLNGGRS